MASKRSDETDHSQNRTAVLSGFDRIVTALAYTPILPYADTPTRRYSLYADTAYMPIQPICRYSLYADTAYMPIQPL